MYVRKSYEFCRTWCLFGENDPSDPILTSEPIIVCAWVVVKVPVTVTKFGQNRMSESMQKKDVLPEAEAEEAEAEAETRGKQCPARLRRQGN